MTKTNLLLLKFGTLQTILMGVYHFYIPFQYNWENYLVQESPTLNWSLYSLNNYFSFNLLILALFLGYYLVKKVDKMEIIRVLSLLILIFWIFSVAYQLIDPMPLPPHMKWIGFVLMGVTFMNGIIFLIPILSIYKKN